MINEETGDLEDLKQNKAKAHAKESEVVVEFFSLRKAKARLSSSRAGCQHSEDRGSLNQLINN